jgi:hypothetical protein
MTAHESHPGALAEAKLRIATADAYIASLTPSARETVLWTIVMDSLSGRIRNPEDLAAVLELPLHIPSFLSNVEA